MNKQDRADATPQTKPANVEGEGSYTGTRRYNERLQKHVQNADTEELGEQAKQALEGEEGAELREAERRAKRGPAKH